MRQMGVSVTLGVSVNRRFPDSKRHDTEKGPRITHPRLPGDTLRTRPPVRLALTSPSDDRVSAGASLPSESK